MTERADGRTGVVERRPHLLYVAWGYPPCRGSGVYRAWATANMFARAGWRVTVLTAPRETFTMSTGIDASLERTIDTSIEVVRVPFESGAFDNDLREWSAARANAPELWNVLSSWRAQRSFPERNYGGWRRTLESAAQEIHARAGVDLVLGTANPHVDFIPGHELHASHGVPYVMDYRDAWQLDVFTGRRLTPPGSAVAKWERRLIDKALAVWFVNEPIRDWHAALYPDAADRMKVVANGYDIDFREHDRAASPQGLVFGYVGTISAAVPVDKLVTGWRLARERSSLLAASRIELWGHLNHTGIPNEAVAREMESFAENGITYHGSVPKHQIAEVYDRFDALLLVLGTGRYVTSGKVYEYAATGLPIVSIHDPGNAASEVLRGARNWHPAPDLTPDAIAHTLIDAAEATLTTTSAEREAAREWATQYRRDLQLLPQIESLRTSVAEGRVVAP